MHTRRQLLYDGWLLFLLAGKAKRGRSVNAHFGSTLPLADKIAHCEELYARHGLPTLFRITPFVQPANLDDRARARAATWNSTRRSCRWRRSTSPPTQQRQFDDRRARRAADRGVRRGGRRDARLAGVAAGGASRASRAVAARRPPGRRAPRRRSGRRRAAVHRRSARRRLRCRDRDGIARAGHGHGGRLRAAHPRVGAGRSARVHAGDGGQRAGGRALPQVRLRDASTRITTARGRDECQ